MFDPHASIISEQKVAPGFIPFGGIFGGRRTKVLAASQVAECAQRSQPFDHVNVIQQFPIHEQRLRLPTPLLKSVPFVEPFRCIRLG